MKYKIHVYTVCWNEIDILPFVIDYWKQYADKVVVYDNGSTDGTLEFLSKFSWIEVRHFDSDGFDDIRNIEIKNNCWKESRGIADFVVVSDMDECLFSPILENELDYMRENNQTICGPEQYGLCDEHEPLYDNNKFLHEILTRVYLQKSNHSFNVTGKIMLFDPNQIDDIFYGVGCHTCNPSGNVKLYDNKKIFCLHIQKGFGVEYKIKRTRELRDRLSERNKKFSLGIHYTFTDEKIRENYENAINKSINILNILDKIQNK